MSNKSKTKSGAKKTNSTDKTTYADPKVVPFAKSDGPSEVNAELTESVDTAKTKTKSDLKKRGVKGIKESNEPAAEASPPTLSAQTPKAITAPIRIFQIYFEPWQRELLDPVFYPLDNSKSTSELMEFAVFEQLQRNAVTQGAELWGALSWRFSEKTGMKGADWTKKIVDNPGHDVYFCNPYPVNEAVFHNMWLHGETAHPRFIEVVKEFFAAAGLDEKDMMCIEPSTVFSSANYFVATPKFWERFIPYVKKILVGANRGMRPAWRDLMHSRLADDKQIHPGATYVPFIVERLFPIFMRTEGKDLKGFRISLPEREKELNVHLKLLREMKDVAHRTKSAWLAACWVNYRNLYLSQTQGNPWCEKYLRSVTPTEVWFS